MAFVIYGIFWHRSFRADKKHRSLSCSGMADADFDGRVQWTRRVWQNKILKVRRNEIFVPESSGHKPGLVEAEVMPLHESSGAYFANIPQLCNL